MTRDTRRSSVQAATVALAGVSFWFPETEAPALSNVSLNINPGETVLLCGPSGSGKSTLLRLMMGIVPQFSGGRLAGSISTLGLDPTAVAPRLVAARGAALLAQNPVEGFVAYRVADEVSFGPRNLGLDPVEIAGRVDHGLNAVGLNGFHRRRLSDLSLGQQQRVALAAALAMQPRLLILDEPTAHLDSRTAIEVLDLIGSLQQQTGMTVVLGEHRVSLAIAHVKRVIVLVDGRVLVDGSPEAALASPDVIASDVPIPRALRAAIALGVEPPPLTPEGLAAALASRLVKGGPHPLIPPSREALGDGGLSGHSAGHLRPMFAVPHSPLPGVSPLGTGEGSGVGSALAGQDTSVSAAESLLRFERVTFAYKDSVGAAIRDVSFDVRAGEVVALVGPSGSGKSTLSRLALGLLMPNSGRVVLGGIETRGARVSDLAKLGGLVLQNPALQLLAETVEEELLLGLLDVRVDDREQRFERALERFELRSFRARHPLTLSEGQRRRVALAATLVREPRLLVLDEPTLGQDERGRTTLADVTRDVATSGGAVLAISHDPEFVNDACDRVITLDTGATVETIVLEHGSTTIDALERAGITLADVPAASLALTRLGRPGFARTASQLGRQAGVYHAAGGDS